MMKQATKDAQPGYTEDFYDYVRSEFFMIPKWISRAPFYDESERSKQSFCGDEELAMILYEDQK